MKRYSLTLLLFVFWIGYHLANAPWKGHVHRPWVQWGTLGITLGHHIWTIPSPSIHSHRWLDSASHSIARIGNLARYLFKQYPIAILTTKDQGVIKMTNRDETGLQFPQTIPRQLYENTIPFIQKRFEEFELLGVEPVALVIPPQLTVEREAWPEVLPPRKDWEETSARGEENGAQLYSDVVRSLSPHAIDLYGLYRKSYEQNPQQLLYLAGDYHWSSYGASLAVKAVAERIASSGGLNIQIQQSELEPPTYDRWLLYCLDLPRFFLQNSPALSWRQPLYEVKITFNKQWQRPKRVVVAGTSFMVEKHNVFSFSKVLARALGVEVVTSAIEGGSVTRVFENLHKNGIVARKGDVFILEQPLELLAYATETPPQ